MRRGLVFACLLTGCAAALWTAPGWLPLRDPNAQPDTGVLRNLPPLSRKVGVPLDDGTEWWGDAARTEPDGSLALLRAGAWVEVPGAPAGARDRGTRVVDARFWLGTDEYGRDVFSRLIHGARVSLAVGLLAATVALLFGLGVGLASGLGGPWLDGTLMRVTDVALAFPKMFLLLLLVSVRGSSAGLAVAAIGAMTWMATARVVRSEVKTLRRRPFVDSARAGGAGPFRLALRHIAPALVPTLAAEAALRVGQAILLESSLSFLGLVVPPPTPTWGTMIADGRHRLHDAWWVATFPGVAIALTVLAVHGLAEAARRRDRIRSEANA